MEAVPVDLPVRDHADDDLLGARDHGAEQRLPALGRDLLRVVQQRERAHLVVAQAAVVEQHAGHDEWPRQTAATRLVRPGHEACAELAVEPQELLPELSATAAEDSALLGRFFGRGLDGRCLRLGNLARSDFLLGPRARPAWAVLPQLA